MWSGSTAGFHLCPSGRAAARAGGGRPLCRCAPFAVLLQAPRSIMATISKARKASLGRSLKVHSTGMRAGGSSRTGGATQRVESWLAPPALWHAATSAVAEPQRLARR